MSIEYSISSPLFIASPEVYEHVTVSSDSLSPIVFDGPVQNTIPYHMNIDLTNAPSLIPYYEDLNYNPRVINRTTKYFYYKILDKWLYDDMKYILGYLKVNKDGKVSFVDKVKDFNEDAYLKDTTDEIKKKIKFIEDNVLTQTGVRNTLIRYSKDTNVNVYDLFKVEKFVRHVLASHLISVLKKMIEKK